MVTGTVLRETEEAHSSTSFVRSPAGYRYDIGETVVKRIVFARASRWWLFFTESFRFVLSPLVGPITSSSMFEHNPVATGKTFLLSSFLLTNSWWLLSSKPSLIRTNPRPYPEGALPRGDGSVGSLTHHRVRVLRGRWKMAFRWLSLMACYCHWIGRNRRWSTSSRRANLVPSINWIWLFIIRCFITPTNWDRCCWEFIVCDGILAPFAHCLRAL